MFDRLAPSTALDINIKAALTPAASPPLRHSRQIVANSDSRVLPSRWAFAIIASTGVAVATVLTAYDIAVHR